MKSTFYSTVDRLKRIETTCYQMNYYMLQNEDDALCVTKQVLLELAKEDSFMQLSFEEQKRMLLRRSAHHAFALKGEQGKVVSL